MINQSTKKGYLIAGYDSYKSYQNIIKSTLSEYMEKIILKNGSIETKRFKTNYFIDNKEWSMSIFSKITQFKEQAEKCKRIKNFTITFDGCSNIDNEIKFVMYKKIFSDELNLVTFKRAYNRMIMFLSQFFKEEYPKINSILDIDVDKAFIKWINWLDLNSVQTLFLKNAHYKTRKTYISKTPEANFLKYIYRSLYELTDNREEWDKDIWNSCNLKKYGVKVRDTATNKTIRFNNINNEVIKESVKRYIKQRLINNNDFAFVTATYMMHHVTMFINYITSTEPNWNDLKELERYHIENFLEYLTEYAYSNLKKKNSNPCEYIRVVISSIQKFIYDIQVREYHIAPKKNVRILIFPTDKPSRVKKPNNQVDYIPDAVLEKLIKNINYLHKDIIPIFWIMYKTGLRISDTLCLTQKSLLKLNNEYWIEADISKTRVKSHRIPIDQELADLMALIIKNSIKNSNDDNNPKKYIFVRYFGKRKSKPYCVSWVQDCFNMLAKKRNIVDESGKIYYFKNHAFRHSYAMKMLNGGADILTIKELLAHTSPEMTLRYAKLYDDTKRKVFNKVIKTGVFSFDDNIQLKETTTEDSNQNTIDMLWTNHKLNAIDTPYGTCLQRINGKCNFSKSPPCLTCNNGKPCKDLFIGAYEADKSKYSILINSIELLIENAKRFHRTEMEKENKELLTLYKNILSKIQNGNIIYGRINRLIKRNEENV